jgi:hypothetical protein
LDTADNSPGTLAAGMSLPSAMTVISWHRANDGSLSLLMVWIDDLQRVACRDHAVSKAEEEADALSDVHPLNV